MNLGHIIGSAVRDAVRPPPPRPQTGFWYDVGATVVNWVRITVYEYDPIRYEEFATREDERTCSICGQLDGMVWAAGEGLVPPLHDWCRCTRVYHHIELQTRVVNAWERQERRTASWAWRITY